MQQLSSRTDSVVFLRALDRLLNRAANAAAAHGEKARGEIHFDGQVWHYHRGLPHRLVRRTPMPRSETRTESEGSAPVRYGGRPQPID
jgi:hypothetical protein